jgi:hypothetical protein
MRGSNMPAPIGHAPYNINGEGGRPQKYTEEFINDAADKLEIWMKNDKNVFLEFFCFENDIDDDRIASWRHKNDRFKRAYNRFKIRQRGILQQGALTKKYQFNMAQLVLGVSHNMILKTEQKLTGDASNPISWLIDKTSGKTKDLNVTDNH